ncbi:MAG: Fe-S cluster assembly protein SufD [Verrucomicrobiae bacterium]|nr:Fe-S cluster assembly protein SufD [Verrucomicrobiae bacterium]
MKEIVAKPVFTEISQYLDLYKRYIEPRQEAEPQWLSDLRKRAIEQFVELGFPGTNEEEWRFTNVSALAKFHPKFSQKTPVDEITNDILLKLPFISLNCITLVFVNGHYNAALSSKVNEKDGVYIGSFNTLLNQNGYLLKDVVINRGIEIGDAFTALNFAFFNDGAVIIVPPGVEISKPIHIIHISVGKEMNNFAHLHNIVRAGKDSKVNVIETYISHGSEATFTNSFTDVFADDDASVEVIRCQIENQSSYNIGSTISTIGNSAKFGGHSIALGGKIARHTIKSKLKGQFIEAVFSGIYMGRDSQLIDHHLTVEHIEPHCASHEYFNGILTEKAHGVFNGKIHVHPNAIKTDAKQTNKNLLLSEDATINSQPQLEIYADDVKCTHGATVGRLDQNAIFYLRSRGIEQASARKMLIFAFASEILEHIKFSPACEELEKILNEWLAGYVGGI